MNLIYPTNKLYEANYPSLMDQITKDFQNFHKTQLSWIGKIAAFKMQTLSKILYLSLSVPIPVPLRFFKEINAKLRNLIWNSKKPRVAFFTEGWSVPT